MHRPLLIAWLISGDETYGVRTAVLSLAKGVAGHGHRPVFLSFTDGPFAAALRGMNCNVIHLNAPPPETLAGAAPRKALVAARNALTVRSRARLIAAAAAPVHPDALHVLWPSFVAVAGAAARRLDIPCFWEMPNIVSAAYPLGLNRRLYQWICGRYGIIPLANSRYTAATLGTTGVKAIPMHLGVDPDRFDPARISMKSRAQLGLPESAPVFAIIARLSPEKGQLRFLEALLRITDLSPLPHLLLLGGPADGPEAQAIRAMAERHAAGDRLHLLDAVDDPEAYYGAIDVAVNARIDPEPFGLSVVEAMMMGRPVLAHALGGPAETILDGHTGWLVPDPDVSTWEQGIRRALADAPHWPELRRRAREHAMAFSIPRVAEKYLAIVRDTVVDRAGRRRRRSSPALLDRHSP